MLIYRGKFLNHIFGNDVAHMSLGVEYRNIMDWDDCLNIPNYHTYSMDREIYDVLEPFHCKVVLTGNDIFIEINGDINELILLALRWDPSWGERVHDTD